MMQSVYILKLMEFAIRAKICALEWMREMMEGANVDLRARNKSKTCNPDKWSRE